MVRIMDERIIEGNKRYVELFCLSTDTKPTENLVTGSFCMEVDTGKTYFFNEEAASGSEWIDQDFESGEET